ncbi:MAG: O-antigen ligase family protein [Thermoleophilaceae bacterium]
MTALRRSGTVALLILPGLLAAALSFSAGGYFPGAPAAVAVLLAVALALRLLLAERPVEGLTPWIVVAGSAMALFAVWVLASAVWSGAPARALLEFDRALAYLLALVLFGLTARRPSGVRWLVRGLALGWFAACLGGFVSRTLPATLSVPPDYVEDRLSYPLTYWNAMGLVAVLALILCTHLASSDREPVAARILGAAAAPLVGATLLLTFSRGAIGAGAIGLLVYFVVARPRLLASGLLAVGPATAVAIGAAYNSELLASPGYAAPAGAAQGERLALLTAGCMLGAALLRAALLPLDTLSSRVRLPPRVRRPALAAVAVLAGLGVLLAVVRLDGLGLVERQYTRFVEGNTLSAQGGDVRSRLTDTGNNGRLAHWRVALAEYRAEPIVGRGAGTFQLTWSRDRPTIFEAREAHSLYIEVLSELGLVGAGLLAIGLGAIFLGLLLRCRGPDRAVPGAVLAAGLAWALHAGIDWDWEMPALTLWLFALGGAILAAPAAPDGAGGAGTGRNARLMLSLGCLVLAVTPALVGLSQLRLVDAVGALKRGDCPEAIDAALASNDALSARPEPFEVIGYCDAKLGFGPLASQALEQAIARDPENWELHYGLALVKGAFRVDPRPAARTALRLNPRGSLPREAARRFRTDDPREWERRARTARLPIP